MPKKNAEISRESYRINQHKLWRNGILSGARGLYYQSWILPALLISISVLLVISAFPKDIQQYFIAILFLVGGPYIALYNIGKGKPHRYRQTPFFRFIKRYRNLAYVNNLFHTPFLQPMGICFDEDGPPVEIYDHDYHIDSNEQDTIWFQRGCHTNDLCPNERFAVPYGELSKLRMMKVGEELIMEFEDRTFIYFTIKSLNEYAINELPFIDMDYTGDMQSILINYPSESDDSSLCVMAVCRDSDNLNSLNKIAG